ncbi:MAG: hypothetical protein ACREPM_14395 [Gemmatimonadaceae bacterium]
MRSPHSARRHPERSTGSAFRFEFACRVGVFALVGWLLGASVFPSGGRRGETVNAIDVPARLPGWTRLPASVALHVDMDATPEPWVTDWLAALERSGRSVTWTGSPTPLAVSAEAVADPRGGTRVNVVAPAGTSVIIRDDVSVIDSVRIASLGGSVTATDVVGRVSAAAEDQTASVVAPDTSSIRSIVVLGSAGWEGKFIVSALEERGWRVTTRFVVAPSVDVGQAPLTLDTARVAAVIAVDTAIGGVSESIERFVRSGGGLILAGPSSLAKTTASLAPGTLGPRFRPTTLPADTIGLGATGFYPVATLKGDAVAVERRTGGVAIAARRVGAGRVLQVGYDDSWRWRMAGGTGSEAAHRAWWSRLVSGVAYAPPASGAAAATGSAPLATMIDRIGPARPLPPGISGHPPIDHRVYLILILLLLLAEWASRRLRGLR